LLHLVGNQYAPLTVQKERLLFRVPLSAIIQSDQASNVVTMKLQDSLSNQKVICIVESVSTYSNHNYIINIRACSEGFKVEVKVKETSPVKVAVLGSCVTRDNFNSQFNENYKEFYECIALQNQSSIISLMGKPVQYKPEEIDGLNEWDRWNVKTDLDKTFLTNLQTNKPDYLIVDLFADVLFGCIEIEKQFVTNNRWKLWKTSYYKHLSNFTFIHIEDDFKYYMELWSCAINQLFIFLKEYLPNCKVVLHKSRFADKYIDENGKFQTLVNSINVEKLNRYWEQLDDYIKQHFNVAIIDLTGNEFLLDRQHPWGLFNLHFESTYYHHFLRALNEIVLKDRIAKQSSVRKALYKEVVSNN